MVLFLVLKNGIFTKLYVIFRLKLFNLTDFLFKMFRIFGNSEGHDNLTGQINITKVQKFELDTPITIVQSVSQFANLKLI